MQIVGLVIKPKIQSRWKNAGGKKTLGFQVREKGSSRRKRERERVGLVDDTYKSDDVPGRFSSDLVALTNR